MDDDELTQGVEAGGDWGGDDEDGREDDAESDGGGGLTDEASYVCWACGEEIVIPVEPGMGSSQDFVEDCPVCCRPNRVRVELGGDGGVRESWSLGDP
ncbi:CPXCG motif-containing cysteine-rich protein [Engelhardtia mirabilis]|uniref:CPXCG motif-containing cysteine-rich protein n=1 Tax=Engelhardtia mirabilis TaxID=2528011 RepID=A0A518BLE1_9BACT|nr:hypothetical protein Pla133_28850 [Planctomycetes bacterium Pla133]QDV02122.1 hypothetical protein Pla86_28840 [Planctomycetes bacterium Pla86]